MLLKLIVGVGVVGGGIVGIPKLKDVLFVNLKPVSAKVAVASSEALEGKAKTKAKATNPLDGYNNTYWAEGKPGAGEGETITFTFDEPIHLGRVDLQVGFKGDAEPRPHVVLVTCFSQNGARLTAKPWELDDVVTFENKFQKLKLNVQGVLKVQIKIVSVYPAVNSLGMTTSISEVRFYARGG